MSSRRHLFINSAVRNLIRMGPPLRMRSGVFLLFSVPVCPPSVGPFPLVLCIRVPSYGRHRLFSELARDTHTQFEQF